MGIDVEHFDLSGRNALVVSAETPTGQAIAAAYEEAGARVTRLTTLPVGEVGAAVQRAATDMGSLQILASAADRFLAKPVIAITPDEVTEIFTANYAIQFYACQAAIEVMLQAGEWRYYRARHPCPRLPRLTQHQRLCCRPWCRAKHDPSPGSGNGAAGDFHQRRGVGMDGLDARPP